MIAFVFTQGLMAPMLFCDYCGERVKDGNAIIGCKDHEQTRAITLCRGECDRIYQAIHGEVIYWQNVDECLMNLAYNAAQEPKEPYRIYPPHPNADRDEWQNFRPRIAPFVFRRDHNACVYCGSGDSLTVDHVKPLSKGGGNVLSNLVTSCRSCNCSKSGRTPEEWKQ